MGDRLSGLSSTTLARGLSVAGHPFLLVPLMIAVATRNWVFTAAIAGGMVLPLLAITLRNVRRGAWSDHDVSRRDQRLGLYRAAFPLLAVSALLLWWSGAGQQLLRGVAAAAVMFALGAIGNRFLKISLHMMIAAYCAVVIVKLYPSSAWPIVPFVAAIAWSRRKLERHTWTEVAVGLAIGTAAAVFATVS